MTMLNFNYDVFQEAFAFCSDSITRAVSSMPSASELASKLSDTELPETNTQNLAILVGTTAALMLLINRCLGASLSPAAERVDAKQEPVVQRSDIQEPLTQVLPSSAMFQPVKGLDDLRIVGGKLGTKLRTDTVTGLTTRTYKLSDKSSVTIDDETLNSLIDEDKLNRTQKKLPTGEIAYTTGGIFVPESQYEAKILPHLLKQHALKLENDAIALEVNISGKDESCAGLN